MFFSSLTPLILYLLLLVQSFKLSLATARAHVAIVSAYHFLTKGASEVVSKSSYEYILLNSQIYPSMGFIYINI